MTSSSEPLLRTQNLTKRFPGVIALKGVDFDLRPWMGKGSTDPLPVESARGNHSPGRPGSGLSYTENSIRRDDAGHLHQDAATEFLTACGETPTLGVC